jgi:hypothetical protein
VIAPKSEPEPETSRRPAATLGQIVTGLLVLVLLFATVLGAATVVVWWWRNVIG